MFYSAKRHREIRDELASKSEVCQSNEKHFKWFRTPSNSHCIAKKIRAADVAKLVSKSWKRLDTKDRAHWEEMARIDKERYEKEKALYKGPWKVPDVKYPDAPKKPMSAFLAFGNERRKAIATANPKMSNAEISSLLSKLWKECPPDVKQGYRDREKHERENFKKHRAEWELMKQREAGVDMPMITASGPLTGPTVSGSSNSFDPHVQNVAAFSGAASRSDDSDTWEEWMPESDFDSDSDAVQSGEKVNTAGIFPCSQPPCLPPIRSGSLVLPKLSTPQSLSIENYTLESFIDDEELFEDFSPQDAPTTAPFC